MEFPLACQDTILVHVKFWDRNLWWYIGVFSAIYAFSRYVRYIDAPCKDDADGGESLVAIASFETMDYPVASWLARLALRYSSLSIQSKDILRRTGIIFEFCDLWRIWC